MTELKITTVVALAAIVPGVAVNLDTGDILAGIGAAGLGLLGWLGSRQVAAHERAQRAQAAETKKLGERLTRLEERHRALERRFDAA